MQFRANSSEIWKRPHVMRYLWLLETNDGLFSGMSWNQVNVKYQAATNVIQFIVVDMFEGRVMYLHTKEEYELFLEEWRNNYFNDKWSFADEKLSLVEK